MPTIPFTKAHGARNDFLLTPVSAVPAGDPAEIARAICDRHTGPGADGWLIVSPGDAECAISIRLLNSDGSDSEMSGNGTRCAAAYAMECPQTPIAMAPRVRLSRGREGAVADITGKPSSTGGAAPEDRIVVRTGAGLKQLRLLGRAGRVWQFEMNMGRAYYSNEEVRSSIALHGDSADVTILNVGNPQCAVFVNDFDFDWRAQGAAIERHPRFPDRTNVSFVRVVDPHTIEVRFWERGAGETMSSGTGSTGAACAAALRGLVKSPIRVVTPAGPLDLRSEADDMLLAGPAEIVCAGEFYWKD